jgi:hypothetical protein
MCAPAHHSMYLYRGNYAYAGESRRSSCMDATEKSWFRASERTQMHCSTCAGADMRGVDLRACLVIVVIIVVIIIVVTRGSSGQL